MILRKIPANVAYITSLTSDDITEHIVCQEKAEYEFLLAFSPSLLVGWLVVFNGPLRQYFSLYRAVSQREGERNEK